MHPNFLISPIENSKVRKRFQRSQDLCDTERTRPPGFSASKTHAYFTELREKTLEQTGHCTGFQDTSVFGEINHQPAILNAPLWLKASPPFTVSYKCLFSAQKKKNQCG